MSYDDDRRAEKRAKASIGMTTISINELNELRRKAAWHDNHPEISGVPENKFESGLRELINSYSKEQGSNTPDFVLASYLVACLDTFDYHVRYRAGVENTPMPGVDFVPGVQIGDHNNQVNTFNDPVGVKRFHEFRPRNIGKSNERRQPKP
jgi:hypothetical protein